MLKQSLFTLLFLITASHYSLAQTETKQKPKDTIPKEVRYNTFKKLYIQMRQSKSHQIADSISQVFFYKITPDMTLLEIAKENRDYMEWTRANLSKTQFSTIEEAEKMWNEWEAARKISIEENQGYYDYLREIRKFEGGNELQMSLMKEVRASHPELYKRIKLPYRPTKKELLPKVGPYKTH
ncbi:MAG: hypothetical protein DI539_00015 [Flavobacterium psychrophilum]|nr:MAG: hypothetical protein DI539_00015 [Flavobacterium psychrophilum]